METLDLLITFTLISPNIQRRNGTKSLVVLVELENNLSKRYSCILQKSFHILHVVSICRGQILGIIPYIFLNKHDQCLTSLLYVTMTFYFVLCAF